MDYGLLEKRFHCFKGPGAKGQVREPGTEIPPFVASFFVLKKVCCGFSCFYTLS